MTQCKNCSNSISMGNVLACKNCGATVCKDCADNTLRICPYCYSDLEFIG